MQSYATTFERVLRRLYAYREWMEARGAKAGVHGLMGVCELLDQDRNSPQRECPHCMHGLT